MSEYRNSYSREYNIDMTTSPSVSDESEHDAIKSPRPTTPPENENLMENLHCALGEALLDQLEMHGLDKEDAEIDEVPHNSDNVGTDVLDAANTPSENVSRHVESANFSAVDVDPVNTDKQTDDVVVPDSTDPATVTDDDRPMQSRLADKTGTNVVSTDSDVPNGTYAPLTRGSDLSAGTATPITTGPATEQSLQITPKEGEHTDIPKGDTEALQKMPPNVADSGSIDGVEEPTTDSNALRSNSLLLDDALENNNDIAEGAEKLSDYKDLKQDEEHDVSPNEKQPSPEEVPGNYSLWGESAPDVSMATVEQNLENNNGTLSPKGPENSVGHDPVNGPVDAKEPTEKAEDVPTPTSRRLPIFASMATEESPPLSEESVPESPATGDPGADLLAGLGSTQQTSPWVEDSAAGENADGELQERRTSPDVPLEIKPVTEAVKQPDLGAPPLATENEPTAGNLSLDPAPSSASIVHSPSSEKVSMLLANNLAPPFLEKKEDDRTGASPRASPVGNELWNVPIGTPSQNRDILSMPVQTNSPGPHPQGYMVVTNPPQVQHFVPDLQKRPMTYGAYAVQTFPKAVLPSAPTGGRRKIKLRLQEDVHMARNRRTSWFSRSNTKLGTIDSVDTQVDRGSMTISWYEGTTSTELQEHVRKSVVRKLGLKGNAQLLDLRIIDETMDPPEEIVLSSYIPDGSEFLLRFATKEVKESAPPVSLPRQLLRHSTDPPISPSAALSPYPSSGDLEGLSADELKVLGATLDKGSSENQNGSGKRRSKRELPHRAEGEEPSSPVNLRTTRESRSRKNSDESQGEDSPEDPIEARLRQITELLLLDRGVTRRGTSGRQEEKKQVIFVLANYFVLFLSLIAISAEIQARAPRWMEWLENSMESVQQCATDRDALFECVSNGDFSGLIASFILWVTRSAATKRIFLFGFESPKRLWTVVYEALVTAICWGTSYTFIRRGMNPDTRRNFLQKYWKDAVYGSLAGFNASFMKQVLKNLIPQEAFEHALDDKELRLKIFSWLPSFH